jgi:hypothetical protein
METGSCGAASCLRDIGSAWLTWFAVTPAIDSLCCGSTRRTVHIVESGADVGTLGAVDASVRLAADDQRAATITSTIQRATATAAPSANRNAEATASCRDLLHLAFPIEGRLFNESERIPGAPSAFSDGELASSPSHRRPGSILVAGRFEGSRAGLGMKFHFRFWIPLLHWNYSMTDLA